MKNGWHSEKLGEVCSFLNRGISPKYLDVDGMCVLNQKCIRDHKINYEPSRRHDCKTKKVSDERLIQLGDVLVNSTGTGTLGRVAQVREKPSEPTTVDSHVTIVRPRPGLFHLDFFGYMLIIIEEAIKDAGEGCGGQTELARSTLAEKFIVHYPASLEQQKRIVAILDEAFEGIAKARANAEKNLQNARELFESYLQEVFTRRDKGWSVKTLGDVCSFVGGSQPPKSVFTAKNSPNNVRLIQIRDYKSDKHLVYIPRSLAKRFCNADDVMIGRYGPPLFQILRGLEGAYNVALMKAVPVESEISRDFLFYFLKHPAMLRHVIYHSARAAGQIGLTKETLEPFPIAVPSLADQKKIIGAIITLESESKHIASTYEQKLTALDELKKSLLQKAFAGQLT